MNTINKIILTVILAHCCQKNILADFKPFPHTLSPEKIAEFCAEKKRQLEVLEKEIKYYGSESPKITNTRIGFIGVASGAFIALLSLFAKKEDKQTLQITGGLVSFAGAFGAMFSGIASKDAHDHLLSRYETAKKEFDSIIIHDSNNRYYTR